MSHPNALDRALSAIRQAQAVALHTGAGMGVDSGLPDFRGPEGFWSAYPPLRHLGLRFEEMANPTHFGQDPALAWGFYGHRLQLYRNTVPHDGVQILRKLIDSRPLFAFTSNIDGHLQAAGLSEHHLMEVHGSLLWLQCTVPCCQEIWSAEDTHVEVDMTQCRAAEPLPRCPHCGAIARPNVLMFGDWSFIGARTQAQGERYHQWLNGIDLSRLAIIEIGAGTAVPTVRRQSEQLQRMGATLIRINPRESHGPPGTISIAEGGLSSLRQLEDQL